MLEVNKVYCGDCLEIMKTLPNGCVDLVVTDPPYNTGMTKSNTANSTWLNSFFDDSFTDEEYKNLATESLKECFRILKENAGIYIYINWKKMYVWQEALQKAGFKLKNCIVWDKVIHGLNYQNYAYTHEFVLFATKGKHRPNNKPGEYWRDVWHIKRMMGRARDELKHETIKAKEVIEQPILHSSLVGGVILDCFAGTGTTGLVARKTGRNYILIEKDPEYCKIIEQRLNLPNS